MKKIVSVFLTVLVLITTIFVTPTFAKNNIELKLSNATIYAGDKFELKLFISDNSQLSGAVIDIEYDNSMLEFLSVEKGGIVDEGAMVSIKAISNNKVRFTYLSPDSSITSEGVLLTVEFKAIENAAGQTDVKILIPSAGDFVNSSAEKLAYSVENSIVKIINTTTEKIEATENVTIEESTSETVTSTTLENTTNNANNTNNDGADINNDNIKIVVSLFAIGGLIILSVIVYLIANNKKKR